MTNSSLNGATGRPVPPHAKNGGMSSLAKQDEAATFVDMFAGCGGLSSGFAAAGFVPVGAFEKDRWAAATYTLNVPEVDVVTGDISDVESFQETLPGHRVDVLLGAPPCQGFSRAGTSRLRQLGGKDGRATGTGDERNHLFREFMRAVEDLRPEVVVMENVPEMARHGEIMEEIRGLYEQLGYESEAKVLSAERYGVPQTRRRLFIIANSRGRSVPWPTTQPTRRTLRDAIGDLPPIPPGNTEETLRWEPGRVGAYTREMRQHLTGSEKGLIRDHVTRRHRPDDIEAFQYMKQGDQYAAVPERLRRYRTDIFKDKYHRMVWDRPAWTVTAHLAKDGYKYIHPDQNRTLSVREAARIQSFPDSFRFAGPLTSRYRQLGNAVPPKLAAVVAQAVVSLVALSPETSYTLVGT